MNFCIYSLLLLVKYNTIIALLLELHKKIDSIIKSKEVQEPKNTETDELITQLKKTELNPRQEKQNIIRKSQKWTFF